eukprot:Pgem_evm1s5667
MADSDEVIVISDDEVSTKDEEVFTVSSTDDDVVPKIGIKNINQTNNKHNHSFYQKSSYLLLEPNINKRKPGRTGDT